MNESIFLQTINKCFSSDDYTATKLIFDLQHHLTESQLSDTELWAAVVYVINMLRADHQPALTPNKKILMRAALLQSLSTYIASTADLRPLYALNSDSDKLALLAYAAPDMPVDTLNGLIRESCNCHSFEYFDQEITAALLPYAGPQEKRLLIKHLYMKGCEADLIRQLIIHYNDIKDSITSIADKISIDDKLGFIIKDLLPDYTQNVVNMLYKIECSKYVSIPEYYIEKVADFLDTLTEEELECIKTTPEMLDHKNNPYMILSVVAGWHDPETLPSELFTKKNFTALTRIIPRLSRDIFLSLYTRFPAKEAPLILLNHTSASEHHDRFCILLKRYLRSLNVHLKLDFPLVEVPPEVVMKLTSRELISLVEYAIDGDTKKKFSLEKSAGLISKRLSLELLTNPWISKLYQNFLKIYEKGG